MGGTLNLDGGTLTLDGGTCPPYNLITAYNLRMVGCSFMKFEQQFERNTSFVYTKFRGNIPRNFGFRARKLPQEFGMKTGLIQKQLQYAKNISHG